MGISGNGVESWKQVVLKSCGEKQGGRGPHPQRQQGMEMTENHQLMRHNTV